MCVTGEEGGGWMGTVPRMDGGWVWADFDTFGRSEERGVGKECRFRGSPDH